MLLRIVIFSALALAKLFGDTPFGIGSCHIHGRTVDDYERWVPEMEEVGMTYNRTIKVGWGNVEPVKGEWSWDNAEAQYAYLKERGFSTGALLIGSPKWNTLDPAGHLPVNNIDGWSDYVTQLVSRFEGRINRFEVWNEPPNFTGRDQTAADYGKLVRASYLAAKEANPEAQVGLTTKSAHLVYLEQAIKAGAEEHYDWISLHPYEIMDGIVTDSGWEPVYLNIVPSLRRMLEASDPSRRDVPVLFTELGVDAERHGAEAQASALLKAYVMGIAQGVANIQWFEGRDGDSGPLGLIDRKGQRRPAFYAYQRMIRTLGQEPEYVGFRYLDDVSYAFFFRTEQGPVMVAWTPVIGPHTLTFPSAVRVVDPLSGESTEAASVKLGSVPRFVTGFPDELLTAAAKHSGDHFPWPGDPKNYSGETTVSIDHSRELGEREQGLHNRSGGDIAKAVVAYGGSARAGDAPGGSVFTVDPTFLSYESVPLKIVAEVRRQDPAVDAGFKLVYESPTGFSTAGGWKTIPAEDDWHVIEWTIEDPRFVNYWGYNFRLESDGDTFNKYFMRKITVTKLDGGS